MIKTAVFYGYIFSGKTRIKILDGTVTKDTVIEFLKGIGINIDYIKIKDVKIIEVNMEDRTAESN